MQYNLVKDSMVKDTYKPLTVVRPVAVGGFSTQEITIPSVDMVYFRASSKLGRAIMVGHGLHFGWGQDDPARLFVRDWSEVELTAHPFGGSGLYTYDVTVWPEEA